MHKFSPVNKNSCLISEKKLIKLKYTYKVRFNKILIKHHNKNRQFLKNRQKRREKKE